MRVYGIPPRAGRSRPSTGVGGWPRERAVGVKCGSRADWRRRGSMKRGLTGDETLLRKAGPTVSESLPSFVQTRQPGGPTLLAMGSPEASRRIDRDGASSFVSATCIAQDDSAGSFHVSTLPETRRETHLCV
jgi:hypothetical protein